MLFDIKFGFFCDRHLYLIPITKIILMAKSTYCVKLSDFIYNPFESNPKGLVSIFWNVQIFEWFECQHTYTTISALKEHSRWKWTCRPLHYNKMMILSKSYINRTQGEKHLCPFGMFRDGVTQERWASKVTIERWQRVCSVTKLKEGQFVKVCLVVKKNMKIGSSREWRRVRNNTFWSVC